MEITKRKKNPKTLSFYILASEKLNHLNFFSWHTNSSSLFRTVTFSKQISKVSRDNLKMKTLTRGSFSLMIAWNFRSLKTKFQQKPPASEIKVVIKMFKPRQIGQHRARHKIHDSFHLHLFVGTLFFYLPLHNFRFQVPWYVIHDEATSTYFHHIY